MTDNQLSRKPKLITEIPSQGELFIFSDQQNDSLTVSGVSISTSSFLRLGMKEATFNNCSFTQSYFEDSYFRKAIFKNVRFTGSTFKFCNFDKASFQSCDLRYCNFHCCKLPRDEIVATLPTEPNLKRDLARNLRANFESLGDKKSADAFLDIEIQAYEEELKAIFFSKTEYYRTHYDRFAQFYAGLKYCGSIISGVIWGYGHRVGRLLASYAIITFLLSLLTYFSKINFFVSGHSSQRPLNLKESLYLIFSETLNASGASFIPATSTGKLILLAVSFLGTLFLALLAATLYRRIAR